MKVRRPWFKFWPSEWLANRRVALMKPAEKGIYIDLLALCWQEGAIPADPVELAFLLRLPRAEFNPLWAVVKKHFRPSNGRKFLTNNRLELERGDAKQKSTQAQNAANSRWLDDADAMQTHCDSIETAMPHKKMKKEDEDEEKEKDLKLAIQGELPRFDFEAIYDAFPGSKGKAKGIDALEVQVKTQALYDTILAAAKAYAAEEAAHKASGSKAFRPDVPYFSTWVNQRRWEDRKESTTSAPVQMGLRERELERDAKERGFSSHADRLVAEGRA